MLLILFVPVFKRLNILIQFSCQKRRLVNLIWSIIFPAPLVFSAVVYLIWSKVGDAGTAEDLDITLRIKNYF